MQSSREYSTYSALFSYPLSRGIAFLDRLASSTVDITADSVSVVPRVRTCLYVLFIVQMARRDVCTPTFYRIYTGSKRSAMEIVLMDKVIHYRVKLQKTAVTSSTKHK